MKITKEIGYELLRVVDMDGFMELWNRTDTETKDKIVNGIGELAIKLVNQVETSTEKCNLHGVSNNEVAVCDDYDPEVAFPTGNGKCKNCGKYH